MPFSQRELQESREREDRIAALNAAVRAIPVAPDSLYSKGDRENHIGKILLTARTFQEFIETGTWANDPEGDGPGLDLEDATGSKEYAAVKDR